MKNKEDLKEENFDPNYGHIIEGKEISGGIGKIPTGPKPKIEIIAQK